ncbi:hypothetical protein ACWD5R_23820 [Streptomyces sp. NPDC002514]|uniref:hypothetical protein n=1 Tax=Streptomyces sp. NPDC001270 TaxID=3364554 RepID=UPI00368E0BF4
MSTFRQAHQDVHGALRTYVGVLREQRRRADEASSAAAGDGHRPRRQECEFTSPRPTMIVR